MLLRKPLERRESERRTLNRLAKIQINSALPRDCLVTDISDGGVRLHVEGFEVPDEFVLILYGEGIATRERVYRVVWRLGYEVGAQFVRFVQRSDLTGRG